jgi:hypothetical protein
MVDKPAGASKVPSSKHARRIVVNVFGVIMARLPIARCPRYAMFYRRDGVVSDSTATVILYTRCGDIALTSRGLSGGIVGGI